LNENLILADFADEEVGAVAQRSDSRQWRFDETPPIRLIASGFEAEFLGAPEHFRYAEVITETVAYLCGIGTYTVETQQ
jgi:hypothetical protein